MTSPPFSGSSSGTGEALAWTTQADLYGSAFTTGYSRVRAIPLVDMEAIGLFVPIRHILWVGNFASRIPLTGARVLSSDWFRNELELVRKWDGLTVH